MPRVARPPGAPNAKAHGAQNMSPMKIPLNDDRQEKSLRLQSRQALHDLHINQIKAAASPIRKPSGHERSGASGPQTPQSYPSIQSDDSGGLIALVPGSSMTPLKRVPILANFEEWMKMATDNKINATNSWNFALIDYFHDMSLLREGDSVNFQKASCTLDGCVKIYTSRVDSVATETGKLLSGLADGDGQKSSRGASQGASEDGAEDGEDDDDGDDGDGMKKRPKKKAQRSSESTLVQNFNALQLKKFEVEFAVDPLFKKASADFDEGGAKGLLLNHLSINGQGRIVFDSSDNANSSIHGGPPAISEPDVSTLDSSAESKPDFLPPNTAASFTKALDLEALRVNFFPSLELLDGQDICPTLKTWDIGDPSSTHDIPCLKDISQDSLEAKAPDHDTQEHENEGSVDMNLDVVEDAGFGEGGELWVKSADLESMGPAIEDEMLDGTGIDADEKVADEIGRYGITDSQYSVLFQQKRSNSEDVLKYFDTSHRHNWAGPEHWKIKRMKNNDREAGTGHRRKEKESLEINFLDPLDPSTADVIYTKAPSTSAIALPKAGQKSRSRNLLPDDKHFNSKQMLELFLKPQARLAHRKRHTLNRINNTSSGPRLDQMDEAFWARQDAGDMSHANEPSIEADYDANFFQDDPIYPGSANDDDDEVFADAREALSPGVQGRDDSGQAHDQSTGPAAARDGAAFGSQLVTQSSRIRPDYVQYAKVAKKVDVRRLKEEMWKGISWMKTQAPEASAQEEAEKEPTASDQSLSFTSIMKGLHQAYPQRAMEDISTSFCFICLLHLANEKGLSLTHNESLEELSIRREATLVNATAA